MTLKAISIAPSNYENLAEMDRSFVDAVGRRTHGVIFEDHATTLSGITNLRVEPGSGHTVNVLAGKAVIREKTNALVRGGYYVQADATENLALPATDTQPFFATIIFRVIDAQYGTIGSNSQGPAIVALKGTPSASPVALTDAAIDAVASTPGGWLRLADVLVNTGDTGAIPAGQFTDKRRPGGFGRINCLSTCRPIGSVVVGINTYEWDTKAEGTWNGSYWSMKDSEWQQYNSGWSSTGAAVAIANGAILARAKRDGRQVHHKVDLVFGSATNGGTGGWFFNMYPGCFAGSMEEVGLCKAYAAGPYPWTGHVVIAPGSNYFIPHLPMNSGDNRHSQVRNADTPGTPGTSVPQQAGVFAFTVNCNLHCDFSVESTVFL